MKIRINKEIGEYTDFLRSIASAGVCQLATLK